MTPTQLWQRYQRYLCRVPALGLTLDVSRMRFDDGVPRPDGPAHRRRRFAAMDALEKGAIANPDENRMVGHYWLRAPDLAPTAGDRRRDSQDRRRHQGVRRRRPRRADQAAEGATGSPACCRIGIGGSALGPMFVADALGDPADRQDADRLHRQHRPRRDRPRPPPAGRQARRRRSCVVTSKSGGTPETRNGMLLVADAYQAAGLDFAQARGRDHDGRLEAGPDGRRARAGWPGSRCGTGSAAGPASCPPSACCRRRCRGSTSTACSPARPPGRGHPRPRPEDQPRRPAGPDVAPRHRRQGPARTWSSCRTRTGCSCSAATCSSSSWSRSASSSTWRASGSTRGSRLRQQGLDRPARLRPAAPRRRAQLLRHVHPGAGGRRLGPRGRAGRDGRRLPARLPARHPRGPVRERPRVDDDHRPAGRRPDGRRP